MATEAQRRAIKKYNSERTKQVIVRLNMTTDADILEKLVTVPNKTGYIKGLIRSDMERG